MSQFPNLDAFNGQYPQASLPINSAVSVDNVLNDNTAGLASKVSGILDSKLSNATKDYLVEYYLNEQSAINAHQRSMNASSTQYQRAVADLRKAGINPFLALQSLGGSLPTSQAGSTSGGYYSERENAKRKNAVDIGGKIGTVIAIIAAAVVGALL